MMKEDTIKILGARVHNLKNIDLEIPRRKLVVITGLSGSGKSSLAFDTIYAEGQRRYMETLSTYARQFVGTMERPDVDKITGLSPVVAIEQKTTNKNPRSTVGTVTEINDFLRLLYARASRAYSPVTGEEMVHYTDEQIAGLIMTGFTGRKIALMAPIVKGRKGHYRELFESLAKKGYIYARIDGEIREISAGMRLDRYKIHTIDLVVDRLVVGEEARDRVMTSLRESLRQGKGTMAVYDYGTEQQRFYSRHLMCPSTGIAFEDPAPHTFSFNSPQGACPHCNGLGEEAVFDVGKIIPDMGLSLREGAVEPLGKYRNNMLFAILEMLGRRYDFTLDDPVGSLPEPGLNAVLYGDSEPLTINLSEFSSSGGNHLVSWEGVAEYIGRTEDEDSKRGQKWREQFLVYRKCSVCGGSRLKKEALQFRIGGKSIADVSAMSISEFSEWVAHIEDYMDDKEWKIAQEVVKEIRERLRFLMDVGLGYLSLSRSSRSLSGGESQRIRLATQIGSKLVNVLYILDEPSIGLHQRDNRRLIRSLEELRDAGNSVIVVEHEEEVIRAADWIVDIGPEAGYNGGEVVFSGPLKALLKEKKSLTADYLTGRCKIAVPTSRRSPAAWITVKGARQNNLKNIDVRIPLGVMTCITGVSGSGKSSLAKGILYPALRRLLFDTGLKPGDFDAIEGDLSTLRSVEMVDQNPIGKSSRSNPVTYIKAYDEIRKLYADQPYAQRSGFNPSHFSFNIAGGRCEECQGEGFIKVGMQFMADVELVCEACGGKRFKDEILEVRYREKSIYDILEMTVDDAIAFFGDDKKNATCKRIIERLRPLQEVGLGYIRLGQSSSTLSGGESQRVKLASFLSKESTEGNVMFIFDEPTTGLHFHDINKLLDAFNALIARGHTIVIVEHNMDVIKCADWVVDLGPEAGDRGGSIVFEGTPDGLAGCKESYTGRYLALREKNE